MLMVLLLIAAVVLDKKQNRSNERLIRKIESITKLIKAYDYEAQPIKLEKLALLDNVASSSYQNGALEMKKHKAVITGIARDNIYDLLVMMQHIEHLGQLFADYRVIIFENDSKDGTKNILSLWQTRNPKISILNKDFHNAKRPNIGFLANARNYYLTALASPKYKNFNMLIVVDMDMSYGFDVRGIQDSFAKIEQWDAVCSNGISNANGEMYDMFAFRNDQYPWAIYDTKDYWRKISKGQRQIFTAGSGLVPVQSCFGGMALYKREFIGNCKYTSIQGDCEHVAFHECLRKSHARIFLNPTQIIRYSHFK
jgi:hypothetical protein